MTFSVVRRNWSLRSFRHRGGGSAGAGSMPVAEAVITPSQAIVTADAARGSAVSAGVPTWQAGHAMTPPSAACPSQQEQGSCAGFAAATTTAGKATHRTAATRASVDRMRAARVITSQGYEGRGALSVLSRPSGGHDRVTGIITVFRIFQKYRLTSWSPHPRFHP
jgi:hypothetical protein